MDESGCCEGRRAERWRWRQLSACGGHSGWPCAASLSDHWEWRGPAVPTPSELSPPQWQHQHADRVAERVRGRVRERGVASCSRPTSRPRAVSRPTSNDFGASQQAHLMSWSDETCTRIRYKWFVPAGMLRFVVIARVEGSRPRRQRKACACLETFFPFPLADLSSSPSPLSSAASQPIRPPCPSRRPCRRPTRLHCRQQRRVDTRVRDQTMQLQSPHRLAASRRRRPLRSHPRPRHSHARRRHRRRRSRQTPRRMRQRALHRCSRAHRHWRPSARDREPWPCTRRRRRCPAPPPQQQQQPRRSTRRHRCPQTNKRQPCTGT